MKLLTIPVFALVTVFAAGPIWADEHEGHDHANDADMQKWMEMSTPGASHQSLAAFVGTWDTKVKMWSDPSAPATESDGSSVNSLILGGRYLEQRFTGSMMGGPFEGLGYTGYDNFRKQFFGWWMDTASTAGMYSTGSWDEKAKRASYVGTMDDCMSGQSMKFEETLSVLDDDHHTFEMWTVGADGSKMRTMEIQYTRRK